MRPIHFIPLFIFMTLVVIFSWKLYKSDEVSKSVMIGKNIPEFSINTIDGGILSNKDLLGKKVIINIFASWCTTCLFEHPLWMENKDNIELIGIAWRDDPKQTKKWLERWGNPYKIVGLDPDSKLITSLGVVGSPETFFVDEKGIIIEHVVGVVSEELLKNFYNNE